MKVKKSTRSAMGPSRGWIVTLSGTVINLALGVLYSWSVFKGAIPESWGWTNAEKALPYAVACFVFSLSMIPAGRLQDRIGPRWVATMGGILIGLGFVVASLSGSSSTGFILGFGILGGMGIGFGYASATPAAVKWFPPEKTGLITGIVVSGFGLASVYIAPLASWLLQLYTLPQAMMIFGIAFFIVVLGVSQLLSDPPERSSPPRVTYAGVHQNESSWREMLSTREFYVLWITYFIGAGTGLTFISFAQDLGKKSLGELAFLAVAVLAFGNAAGRIMAGFISDKMGRERTIFYFLLAQALTVFLLYLVKEGTNWILLLLITLFLGANYGSNLSLFPSATKDYFGIRNFGMNYGILFTSWGFAGLILPWVGGKIKDVTGETDLTFFILIALLLFGASLIKINKPSKREK
ncbi:MAG: OFA family MFS transporter [Desulfobacterota bacterium]|nr:OFA family MFS transporter [Thermodesulfobacteriota bacterium]